MTTPDLSAGERAAQIVAAHVDNDEDGYHYLLKSPRELREDIADALSTAERERDDARAKLRELADADNPEHYGNARDALHMLKKSAAEFLDGPEPDLALHPTPEQRTEQA